MKTYVPAAFSQVPLCGGVGGGFLHRVCRIVTCWAFASSVILCVSHAQVSELTVENITVERDATVHGKLVVVKPAPITETTGLTAYYPLDGNAEDAAGNNDGKNWDSSRFVTGKVEQAYSFDDNIRIELTEPIYYGTYATFSVWINLDETASMVIGRYGNKQCTLLINYPTDIYVGAETDAQVGWVVPPLSFHTWHHIAVTKEGNILRLYVNGEYVDLRYQSTITPTQYIGFGVGSYMHGLIDEFRVYDRALSDAEIASLSRVESWEILAEGEAAAEFHGGIKYVAPLGDLSMGDFTQE